MPGMLCLTALGRTAWLQGSKQNQKISRWSIGWTPWLLLVFNQHSSPAAAEGGWGSILCYLTSPNSHRFELQIVTAAFNLLFSASGFLLTYGWSLWVSIQRYRILAHSNILYLARVTGTSLHGRLAEAYVSANESSLQMSLLPAHGPKLNKCLWGRIITIITNDFWALGMCQAPC